MPHRATHVGTKSMYENLQRIFNSTVEQVQRHVDKRTETSLASPVRKEQMIHPATIP
jgi:hypothetical protein